MIPKHFDFSRSTFNDGKEDNSQPKVAWLMSYPNSGTSYTIHLIRESSNTTTATNVSIMITFFHIYKGSGIHSSDPLCLLFVIFVLIP
jgi:hypothetical protein